MAPNGRTIEDASISRPLGQLMIAAKNQYNIENFVETGTNLGETAEWASDCFESVVTIEFSDNIYAKATARRGDIDNIEFVKGKSQNKLKEIVSELNTRSIFYLDAHTGGCWASEEKSDVISDTNTNPCPILDEIAAIGEADRQHFIFIDDAGAFLTPPRVDYERHNNDWASVDIGIQELVAQIEDIDEDYYITSWEESILAVPPDATEFIKNTISAIRKSGTN